MTRWDLVYKWSDPKTQSLVDAVTSALENCDRKLHEAEARAASPSPVVTEALRERILLEAAHLNYFQSPASHWKLRSLLDAALAAVPAPSPAVAPLDWDHIGALIGDALDYTSDGAVIAKAIRDYLDQPAYAEASEQAASPGEGEPA